MVDVICIENTGFNPYDLIFKVESYMLPKPTKKNNTHLIEFDAFKDDYCETLQELHIISYGDCR